MAKTQRPPVGSKLWDVHENMYYDKSVKVAPLVEYVVTEGTVTGYFEGGYVQSQCAMRQRYWRTGIERRLPQLRRG